MSERPEERHAADVIGRAVGASLSRISEHGRVDYECASLNAAFEVKQVTSEALIAGMADGSNPKPRVQLRQAWIVSVNLPWLDRLLPIGELDPPEDIPLETPPPSETGPTFRMVTRKERMARPEPLTNEAIEAHQRPRKATARSIEPLLIELEELGITDYRNAWDSLHDGSPVDDGWAERYRRIQRLHAQIANITLHGQCYVQPLLPPGLHLTSGGGFGRPLSNGLCAEMLARRTESYLHSNFKSAKKLLRQLEREDHARRHAVLLFDSSEPTYDGFLGCLTDGITPTYSMELPAPVSDVWVLSLQAHAAWSYSEVAGWQHHASRSAAPPA